MWVFGCTFGFYFGFIRSFVVSLVFYGCEPKFPNKLKYSPLSLSNLFLIPTCTLNPESCIPPMHSSGIKAHIVSSGDTRSNPRRWHSRIGAQICSITATEVQRIGRRDGARAHRQCKSGSTVVHACSLIGRELIGLG